MEKLAPLTADESEKQFPGPSEFSHLHCHTLFSVLDGVAAPDDYFKACVERNWPAVAITEHGVLNSVPDAYLAAKEFKKKFIVGNEVYFNDFELKRRELTTTGVKVSELRTSDPELAARISRNRHLTVLCKNMTGYQNLLRLNKYAWANGFYYKPRIWFDQLAKHREGLIILSGCFNGPVSHELRNNNFSQKKGSPYIGAVDYVKKFKEVFGDDYYIELQMPGVDGDIELFQQLAAVADHFKIKTVISNDCWNEDVPVLTSNGTKRINEIKIGDLVWTHNGRLREVMCIGKRKIRSGEKIYGFLGGNLIYCTGNHKIFSKTPNFKPSFKAIENLSSDDFVCITGFKLPNTDLKTIRLSDYITSNRLLVKNRKVYPYRWNKKPVNDEYKLTDEILYMIGCFIAEGNIDGYRLSFASHRKEQKVRNTIINFFKKLGFSPQEKQVTENGFTIRICCSAWTYFLADSCGNGKHNKRLPSFWTSLSNRQLKVLLRGYFDGDGCHSRRVSFTVSRFLNSDLLHAFSSLGLKVGCWLRKPKKVIICNKKDGRKVKTKLSEGYYISYPKETYESLGYDIGVYDKTKIRSKSYIDKYGLWIKNPFKEIEPPDNEVWCIQVDEDASFCVGVTSSNCHYLNRNDFEIQRLMMAIDQKVTINDPNLFHVNSDEQYLKTRHELRATFVRRGFKDVTSSDLFERSCDNTLEVADKCTTFKPNLDPKLPNIADAKETLVRLVAEGLRKRGLHKDKNKYFIDGVMVTHLEQAQIELSRIIEKGFESYFLITEDLIKCSKSHKWPIGPARGSSGGSLVCYLIGIQSLNPLFWGLSFNRFLSPARGGWMQKVSMDK